MLAGKRCLHCGNRVGASQVLCSTCKLGVDKYPDQNPPIVTVYVQNGLAELEHLLSAHADFDAWLTIHEGGRT